MNQGLHNGYLHDDDDVVTVAASFGEEILARADEFETQGFVSQDLADRLAARGLLRLCNPPTHGGPGRTPMDYGRLVEALAQYDGSTGWVAFIGITSALAACQLAPETVSEILANPAAITAGVFAPMGRAVACEDNGITGFRLNGQWQWGSGSYNASFISGGGFVVDESGQMLKLADGSPDQRSFMMPISDVELLNTWQVSGLKATGSTDFRAVDVFVPLAMCSRPFTPSTQSAPIHHFPLFAALGIGIGAVALGLAGACRRDFLALAGEKTPMGSTRSLAMKPATQRRVADASARLRAARLYFFEAITEAWQSTCEVGATSLQARADVRLATTHAVNASIDVIDSLYTLAGGSSVYLRSPLQRHFRDVHVASQHMMVNEASLELIGRIELGIDTNTSQL